MHRPFNWELPFLCANCKTLSTLCREDLCSPGLCGNCPFRDRAEGGGSSDNQIGSLLPVPHLPYKTKEGNDASFMIAKGPHISVNTILGLPFVLATGAILDFVDMVVECKYLDCLPFPIDFRRTSNHVPVMDEPDASVQIMQFNNVVHEIENLECYYDAKVQAGGSKMMTQTPAVLFGTKSAARAAVSDSGSVDSAMYPSAGIGARWVPPSSVYEVENDYPSSVLREDSYLRVTACWPS
jgi:hypothetical protein